ncbi:nitrilase-related carbon-nitrogen hydrolase [Sinomonas halotolerans]|uniref:Nitrilase-related carbon-nitrogen hydrolase n=1 Tax=Sinomonas halotolerans TaxID=1644133 RepID=A0ABU9X0J0_9MICC
MAQRQPAELTRPEEPCTLRVGLLQAAPVFGAVDDNVAHLAALRSEVGPVDLAVAPELSLNGYGFARHSVEDLITPHDPRLAPLHQGPGTVGIGFAEENPAGLPWNSYLLMGDGGSGHVQHKIHPVSYAPWNEHLLFEPGTRVAVTEIAGAKVATVICNDMWHPAVPWLAARSGAEVLVVPVASIDGADPAGIKRTWRTILEHTALLLQCYVVFVNRSGTDSGVRFWGGSRVLGPDGAVLAELAEEPNTAVADLDLSALRRLREDVPILAESRTDFLGSAIPPSTAAGAAAHFAARLAGQEPDRV